MIDQSTSSTFCHNATINMSEGFSKREMNGGECIQIIKAFDNEIIKEIDNE
jgi:hypothetical protein